MALIQEATDGCRCTPSVILGLVSLHVQVILSWSKDSGWPRTRLICSLALTRVPGSSSCALMKLRTQPNNQTSYGLQSQPHVEPSNDRRSVPGSNSIDHCKMPSSTALYIYRILFGALFTVCNEWWAFSIYLCIYMFCLFRYVAPGMHLIYMNCLYSKTDPMKQMGFYSFLQTGGHSIIFSINSMDVLYFIFCSQEHLNWWTTDILQLLSVMQILTEWDVAKGIIS